MMTITEIKLYIETAVIKFKDYFPEINIPPIVVCPSAKRKQARDKILQECGLSYKEDSLSTLAEVVSGEKMTKIVLYQARMKSGNIVNHCVWHELGHILFGDEKQFGITKSDFQKGTLAAYGYGLFNEFIAEYTAYVVNDFQPLAGNYLPNAYLHQAFYSGDCLIQYYLSQYYAVILGDETISDEVFNNGKTVITPQEWGIVHYIMSLLFKQTEKEEFWKVDYEFLKTLGYLCDKLLK